MDYLQNSECLSCGDEMTEVPMNVAHVPQEHCHTGAGCPVPLERDELFGLGMSYVHDKPSNIRVHGTRDRLFRAQQEELDPGSEGDSPEEEAHRVVPKQVPADDRVGGLARLPGTRSRPGRRRGRSSGGRHGGGGAGLGVAHRKAPAS